MMMMLLSFLSLSLSLSLLLLCPSSLILVPRIALSSRLQGTPDTNIPYLVAVLVRLLAERSRRVVVVVVVLPVVVVVLDETADNGQQREGARTHTHTRRSRRPRICRLASAARMLESIYLALRKQPFTFVPGCTASVRYWQRKNCDGASFWSARADRSDICQFTRHRMTLLATSVPRSEYCESNFLDKTVNLFFKKL